MSCVENRLTTIRRRGTVIRTNKVKCKVCVSRRALSVLPTIKRRIGVRACLGIHRSTVRLCKFLANRSLRIFELLVNIDKVKPGTNLGVLSYLSPSRLHFTILTKSMGAVSSTPKVKGGATRGLVLRLGSGVDVRSILRRTTRNDRRSGRVRTASAKVRTRTMRTLATLNCKDTRDLHTIGGMSISYTDMRSLLERTLGGLL